MFRVGGPWGSRVQDWAMAFLRPSIHQTGIVSTTCKVCEAWMLLALSPHSLLFPVTPAANVFPVTLKRTINAPCAVIGSGLIGLFTSVSGGYLHKASVIPCCLA